MKYKLKSNEFSLAMQLLAGMVHLENDPDILNVRRQKIQSFFDYIENMLSFLQVHINTAIPAAPRCNELVVNYKQLCRSRHIHLMTPKAAKPTVMDVDADDVFIIDDDSQFVQ